MTISGSKLAKPASLLPFGYFVLTRVGNIRDLGYLVASSWLPAMWFLFRTSGSPWAHVLLNFVAGYLAFIAIYEIGYLANDSWDARKSSGGRQRTPFRFGPAYLLAFVVIRLSAWVAIGQWTGWLANPIWLAGYAALVLAFAQHNLIAAAGLRSASFFQLATLRFVLPIVAAVPAEFHLLLFLAAILFYAYLRLLSYLESKDLLVMPERRGTNFGLIQLAMLSPLILLVALIAKSQVMVELLVYFGAVYGLWWQLARRQELPSPR